MNRQSVFRAGLMTPSPDAGPAWAVTREADARRPHPVGRLGSLFAAPSLPGVVRWVLGNDMCRYETRVRELSVDADTTFAYQVSAWERTNAGDPASLDAYWATGVTLTDWLARPGLDASEWEVLVRPEAVLSSRNVSAARFLSAAPDWRVPELKRVVRRWRLAA